MSTSTKTNPPTIELPPLPYALTALEPHISKETLEYHYGKHHQAYVTKLNTLLPGTGFESATLENIIQKATGPVFNNAAQVWNHTFYWHCLKPNGGGEPTGELAKNIISTFGSFSAFQEQFTNTAIATFGSGWAWLVITADGKLTIGSTPNQDNPLMDVAECKCTPILGCDVWEHAYYIDYRNVRPDYLNAFWQLVNWDFVTSQLSS